MSVVYESRTANDRVWNVNPDNDSVSVFDVVTGGKLAEIAVGSEPSTLALAPDGRMWVINKHSASISIVSPDTFMVEATVPLPEVSEPFALVFDPAGNHAYVSLEAAGAVLRLNALDGTESGSVATGMNVRHLSITADGVTILAPGISRRRYPARTLPHLKRTAWQQTVVRFW